MQLLRGGYEQRESLGCWKFEIGMCSFILLVHNYNVCVFNLISVHVKLFIVRYAVTQYQPYMYNSVPCTQSTLMCTYCLVLSHCFYDAYGVHRNVFRMSDEYNSYENDTCARHLRFFYVTCVIEQDVKRRILTA